MLIKAQSNFHSVVLGIQLLEICVNFELFYNAQSYPLFTLFIQFLVENCIFFKLPPFQL